MNKKFLVPVLAVSIVGGGVAGSLINTSVFASSSDSNSEVEVSEEQEQGQLEKEATITKKEAVTAALNEVSGKATETELEDEDGTVVYGVEVTDKQGKEHDVKIDAKTGEILTVEAEDENEKGEKEEKEDGEVSDKEEQKQLKKEAKFTEKESISIALKEVDGEVSGTELEDENGAVVYSVEIIDNQGQKHEIAIDAKTGKVLKVEIENGDENESDQE